MNNRACGAGTAQRPIFRQPGLLIEAGLLARTSYSLIAFKNK